MCLMPYANNKGADQRSLISTFVVRCLDSMICILEQAGLNLTWSKIPKDTFSHDVAHLNTIEYPPYLVNQKRGRMVKP